MLKLMDALEDNDSISDTTHITNYTYDRSGLQICSADDDCFDVYGMDGEVVEATITFNHSAGNLDLYLYDTFDSEVDSGVSNTDNESVYHWVDFIDEGTFTVCVRGNSGAENTYDIQIQAW